MNLRKKTCVPEEVIEGRDHMIKEVCVKEQQEQNVCVRGGKQGAKSDYSTDTHQQGHSPTGSGYSRQSWLLVTGSVNRPRRGRR